MSESWRVAKSLDTILVQVNAKWPDRDKSSDGTAPSDAHHQQNPSSDHEPNADGVVRARDITHDPAHGFDSYAFADMLLRKKDERIKYVISNSRISSGTGQEHPAWVWRPYDGKNPHDQHVHISVKPDPAHYDDPRPWDIGVLVPPLPEHDPVLPVLQLGSTGPAVRKVQEIVMVDGIFGDATKEAVQNFQHDQGLVADGVVGPATWKALLKTVPVPPVVLPPVPGQMKLTGKCSNFGGPADLGVSPSEGLAFIDDISDQPSIFLSAQPPGTTGLARRLNPKKFYIATRWDYDKYPKPTLLQHQAMVRAPKTGKEFLAWPADWGPNEATGRVADISPGLMEALGITTDDTVEVLYPYTPPIVVTPPPPAPADWRDFDIWHWLKSMFFSSQGK